MDAFKQLSKDIKIEFVNHSNRILRSNKTKNVLKRTQYMRLAINSYNKYISEINKYFEQIGYEDKSTVRANFILFKSLIHKYIGAYNIYNFPEPSDGHNPIEIDNDQLEALVRTGLAPDETPQSDPEEIFSDAETNTPTNTNMTTTSSIPNLDFISLCARHISLNYDGNFDTLRSFVNKINFLKAIASTAELRTILTQYVLTKLDQKALSKVRESPTTVDEIIADLKGKIVSKTSKVLEGQMIALTLESKPLSEFQKQAEELAELYQLSLVEEGIPLTIAERLTIDKTVELCRKNTRSAEVKAILSATTHSTPASVISKMITQIDAVRVDKLLSTAKPNKNDKNTRGNATRDRGRGRGRGNGNGHGNASTSGNGNGNGNGTGRGNWRGRRDRGGHNGNRGGHNDRGASRQFYNSDQQIFTVQGNGQVPQQGAQQGQNSQMYQRTQ